VLVVVSGKDSNGNVLVSGKAGIDRSNDKPARRHKNLLPATVHVKGMSRS
jgi:hypothetical protein